MWYGVASGSSRWYGDGGVVKVVVGTKLGCVFGAFGAC
jgi:hypothetical protein